MSTDEKYYPRIEPEIEPVEPVVPETKGAVLPTPPVEPTPPIHPNTLVSPTIGVTLDNRDKARSPEAQHIRQRAMGTTVHTPDGWIILTPER